MRLSTRASQALNPSNSNLILKVLQDPWHPEDRPCGFVNLGLAENSLMHDTLRQHVEGNFSLPAEACTYGDGFTGSNRLKAAIASLLNRHLFPATEVEASHIMVTNGCSSALEQLAWATADAGDGLLLGQPYYGRLNVDPSHRVGANVISVAFNGADPLGQACVEAYERAIEEAGARGEKIAGLLLCNPHNPLGRCYPRETLVAILRLCQKYQIHLICDEIYALSVWSEAGNEDASAPFVSCLSLATSDVIDPALVHIVWGMSKDFGANGFRVGAIISQHNPSLHASLLQGAICSSISSMSDHVTCNLLEDHAWVDSYILEDRRKLAEHYQIASGWAEEHGIQHDRRINAGFFLWVDLGSAYRLRHELGCEVDVDASLVKALMRAKVFLTAGSIFGSERNGWFRLVFSVDRRDLLEGLRRIILALE